MKKLIVKLGNLKKCIFLLLLPFFAVTLFQCKENPAESTANSGSSLRVLTTNYVSGFVDQNSGDFVINAYPLLAAGGNPLSHYTWSLANTSNYPLGTTVEPETGIFKWNGTTTPPPVGVHYFDMNVSDGSTQVKGTIKFTVIAESVLPTMFFTQGNYFTLRLDTAIAGKGYGASTIVGIGSSGPNYSNVFLPLKWELASGDLPGGLAIDQATGVVKGTPVSSASGQDYSFSIKITNHNNEVATCNGNCPIYQIYVK